MVKGVKDEEIKKKLKKAYDFSLQQKDKARKEIECLLSELDPIETLSRIAFISQYIPEGDLEINQHIRDIPVLQLLSGFCLKIPKPGDRYPENKELEMLLDKVEAYFVFFMQDLILQGFKKDTISETEGLILEARLHRIIRQINATIYPFQLNILIRELFSTFDEYYMRAVGFRASKALEFGAKIIDRYEKQVNRRYEEARLALNKAEKDRKNLTKRPENRGFMDKKTSKIDYENFYSTFLLSNTKDLFVFDPEEMCKEEGISEIEEFKNYLNYLSCTFGDNVNFNDALDDNIISLRPFIRLEGGKFFAPISQDLLYNLPRILETLLEPEKISRSNIWQKYQSYRARYTEDQSYEYFARLFPENRIFKNARYVYQGKNCEADIVILYDNKVFLIEVKAGSLSAQSQRGAIESLKKGLKKLVEDAYQQGRRTLEYIRSSEISVFTDKQGDKLLELVGKNKKIFIISITLEPLMSFSASLKELQSLGLFVDNEFPWSVNINELDILTKHILSPTIFIHYLERRLTAIDENVFHAFDELSFLGWYLKHGNFYIPDKQKPNKVSLASGWASVFDNYYLFGKECPRLFIEEDLLKIIRVLESLNPVGYTEIASSLLDFDHNDRKLIVDKMNELIELSKKDHKPHDFSILFKDDLDTGFTFMTVVGRLGLRERLGSYCVMKKYKSRTRKWIGMARDVLDERWYVNEFAYFDYPWKHDFNMDKLLQSFPIKTNKT